jgi:hypothetical protein
MRRVYGVDPGTCSVSTYSLWITWGCFPQSLKYLIYPDSVSRVAGTKLNVNINTLKAAFSDTV